MLTIIGLVFLVAATAKAYKTAKNYGRNPTAWAFITFGTGFGLQIIVPFIFLIIYGVVIAADGTMSPQQIQKALTVPSIIVSVVCFGLSLVAIFLILRYLSKAPGEKSFMPPPQPPENFV